MTHTKQQQTIKTTKLQSSRPSWSTAQAIDQSSESVSAPPVIGYFGTPYE